MTLRVWLASILATGVLMCSFLPDARPDLDHTPGSLLPIVQVVDAAPLYFQEDCVVWPDVATLLERNALEVSVVASPGSTKTVDIVMRNDGWMFWIDYTFEQIAAKRPAQSNESIEPYFVYIDPTLPGEEVVIPLVLRVPLREGEYWAAYMVTRPDRLRAAGDPVFIVLHVVAPQSDPDFGVGAKQIAGEEEI